jgi:Histidine kinase-, DNA gyrase B-, and HSP90-like ATPase
MPVFIGIIETIGERLYTGRITWLREYIQNAIDAKANDIEISVKGGDLTIRDNGNGMDDNELIQEAFSLGSSTKGPDEIGELGIGMYAGVGISDKVIVRTKMPKKLAYLATFDVRAYKELKRSNPEMLFDEALGRVFKVIQAGGDSNSEDHFTEIKFESLNERSRKLLEEGKLADFLRVTVSLPISDGFPWKKEVEGFLGKDNKNVEVALVTDSGKQSLRRFETITEKLHSPITINVKDGFGNQIGKLWACYAETGLALKSKGSGLFVKFKGMTVGDNSVVSFRFDAKDSGRYLGEFVVSRSEGLSINTERSWFSDSDQLDEMVKRGKEVFQQLHSIANADTSYGKGLVRKQEKAIALTTRIDEKIESRDFGEAGRLKEQQEKLLKTINNKMTQRLEALKELQKVAPKDSSPIEKAKLDILSRQELKPISLGPAKPLPPEEKKHNNEQHIMTMLGNYIIDPKIAEVASGKTMKDTTNNVFTLIEVEMRRKLGIPEKKFVEFPQLLAQFKTRFKDKNEPTDTAGRRRHEEAFDGLMNSTHFLLRNPSAHTLMKDMDNSRNICQVLLMGDFILQWLDQWEPRTP